MYRPALSFHIRKRCAWWLCVLVVTSFRIGSFVCDACSQLAPPPNGQIEFDDQTFGEGTTVKFTCTGAFRLSTGGSDYTVRCANNQWTDTVNHLPKVDVTCGAGTTPLPSPTPGGQMCPMPSLPANGGYALSGGATPANGVTVTFSCSTPGWVLNTGAATYVQTCMAPVWRDSNNQDLSAGLKCSAPSSTPGGGGTKACSPPPAPANGVVSATAPLNDGATATFSCNTGYALADGSAPTLTCRNGAWVNANGVMVSAPTCRASATTQSTCPNLSNPANGQVLTSFPLEDGATAQYMCNSGYSVTGPGNMVCRGGQWFDTVSNTAVTTFAQCQLPLPGQCPVPILRSKATYSLNIQTRAEGSVVTYGCVTGYQLAAGATSSFTCVKGAWVDNKGQTAVPPACNDASATGTNNTPTPTPTPTSQTATDTNKNNNAAGSTTAATKGQACLRLAEPMHGTAQLSSSSPAEGDKITFSCSPGFKLGGPLVAAGAAADGTLVLTCHLGKWVDAANKPGYPPTCVAEDEAASGGASSSNAGAVAGGVIAGLVVLGAAGAYMFFRARNKGTQTLTKTAKNTTGTEMGDVETGFTSVSTPTGRGAQSPRGGARGGARGGFRGGTTRGRGRGRGRGR